MSRYTIRTDADIDRDIEGDLAQVVAGIRGAGVRYDAIYLTGGFGRGEGTVRHDGTRWRPVNDYDFFVVGNFQPGTGNTLRDLGRSLARLFQVDFVDLGEYSTGSLRTAAPTIQNYEFQHGSLLLDGSDVLAQMPALSPAEIPPYEFIRLLCNRSAGLLSSELPEYAGNTIYRENQLLKACLAVGDAACHLAGRYHHHYRVRATVVADLAARGAIPFPLTGEDARLIGSAYERKLMGPGDTVFRVEHSRMRTMIASAYCTLASRCTGVETERLSRAEHHLVRRFCHLANSRDTLVRWVRAALRRPELSRADRHYRVLFSQPHFYHGLHDSILVTGADYLWRYQLIPGALNRPWTARSSVRLWFEYCH